MQKRRDRMRARRFDYAQLGLPLRAGCGRDGSMRRFKGLAPGQIDSRAMTEAVVDSDSFVSPDRKSRA